MKSCLAGTRERRATVQRVRFENRLEAYLENENLTSSPREQSAVLATRSTVVEPAAGNEAK